MSSCSSSGNVSEERVGPLMGGRHPQLPNTPALIDGRVVAGLTRKNKPREPKKVPYAVPIFEPGTPSWSSCEHSSTHSILSPEVTVTYPWEVTLANFVPDFQVRGMAKTKSTPRIRTPDELLADDSIGNVRSALPESNTGCRVASSSSSTSSRPGSSSGASGRTSSYKEASTSSSSESSSPGSSGRARNRRAAPVPEIVAEGMEFPGAPTRSNPQDGPGSHFPDPRAISKLKRSALDKQYLLPADYGFVMPESDDTVNESPANYIAVY